MHSLYLMSATLLAVPFASAQLVSVGLRELTDLENAMYNLQSSLQVPPVQGSNNGPSSCTNVDSVCKEKKFPNFGECWKTCVASKKHDGAPLAGNCAKWCEDPKKCGCDKSKDPYWGATPSTSSDIFQSNSQTNGGNNVEVDTIEDTPPRRPQPGDVIVDTIEEPLDTSTLGRSTSGTTGSERPPVIVDTIEEPIGAGLNSDQFFGATNTNSRTNTAARRTRRRR